MVRKVVYNWREKEYKVDAKDIDWIFKRSGLSDQSMGNGDGYACLGLMFLREFSNRGEGSGEMLLEDETLTNSQRALLQPAFETVARHYRSDY